MWKMMSLGLMAVVSFGAAGCGTGLILFKESNGGPPGSSGVAAKTFDLVCRDKVTPNKDGGHVLDGERVQYDENCGSIPGKILGYFHCAPLAHGKWDKYRKEVAEKATSKGCPGVAIRTTPPLVNDGGEAVGAYCIDPAQKD
jgi:hypothetical protein